jgi:Phage tail lysozyme
MAIMLVERLLRDENGNSLNISVPAQSKVAVLGTFPPFIKIRVLELPNQPEGFVTIGAVDATTDLPPTAVLDKGLFARRCAEQEDLYGVSAHYLMSVATLLTDVTNGPVAGRPGDTGPFALSLPEWRFFSALSEFSLGYDDSDIDSWRAQCAVYAVMTYRSQNRVASLINGQPTAAQLYFSQLVGATAAAAGIREQDQTVDDLVNRVSAAEFQADGIDAGGIFVRSGNLLKKSATVKDTLDVIATQLQKAIDDAGRFLVDIGAQPISSNEKPPPTNLRTALARNQWAAYQAALGGGLRDVAARALVADMTGESLNNPTDNHFDVSHMSQGIVQWDTPRSEAIRNQFGSYPKDMSVKDQTRAAIWEIETVNRFAKTKKTVETGETAEDIIVVLVNNYEVCGNPKTAIQQRIGFLQNLPRVLDQTALV